MKQHSGSAKTMHIPVNRTLPSITLHDLPAGIAIRWNRKRKAVVVSAVLGDLLSIRDACQRYALSIEEFLEWKRAAMQNRMIAPCAQAEEPSPHKLAA